MVVCRHATAESQISQRFVKHRSHRRSADMTPAAERSVMCWMSMIFLAHTDDWLGIRAYESQIIKVPSLSDLSVEWFGGASSYEAGRCDDNYVSSFLQWTRVNRAKIQVYLLRYCGSNADSHSPRVQNKLSATDAIVPWFRLEQILTWGRDCGGCWTTKLHRSESPVIRFAEETFIYVRRVGEQTATGRYRYGTSECSPPFGPIRTPEILKALSRQHKLLSPSWCKGFISWVPDKRADYDWFSE